MKLRSSLALIPFLTAAAATLTAAPEKFVIDPAHSSVNFGIRHSFSTVPGSFTQFSGTIVYDPENISASSADATIQVASINTNQPKRDAHLQSKDFFVAEQFPQITFKSKSWTKTGDNEFDVIGDLKIKDVTKEVTLKTKFLGSGPGADGKTTVSGWEGTTKLDRRDFGITAGQPLVGTDVAVTINIEAKKQ